MQSSADLDRQRKFALGTWPLSAAIAILISIAASVLMQWRIGSPQLLVITIVSLLLAALFISVYRSRGRFRLHALLVLMTLVGVGSATIGRRIVFVEKHRGLVRLIAERNGRVIVWGASGQELDGWRMVQGGYVIPSWLLDSLSTDISKQPTGPTGLLPQPVMYWGDMIRESILEEGPAEKPTEDQMTEED